MADNKISVSLPGGIKVLNPTPSDPRTRVVSIASITNDASYYVGFLGIYDESTNEWYNITGGNAIDDWVFETSTVELVDSEVKTSYESNADTNAFTDVLKSKVENSVSADASLYATTTLTQLTTQSVATNITKNAVCNLQLDGNLTLTLNGLTSMSIGVINISAQTIDRTIEIIAFDNNLVSIDIKTDIDIEMITSVDGKVSFTYLYDGIDLLINKGTTYVEVV